MNNDQARQNGNGKPQVGPNSRVSGTHSIADGWPVVLWTNAEDPAAVVADLTELAGVLRIQGPVQDAALTTTAAGPVVLSGNCVVGEAGA